MKETTPTEAVGCTIDGGQEAKTEMLVQVRWILLLTCVLVSLKPAAMGQTVVGSITRPNFRPTALAVFEPGNKVFVADDSTKQIYMFDGATHAELSSAPTDGGVVDMVVHEASSKLYALGPGTIRVIDTNSGGLIRTLAGYSGNALALDPGAGKLYAAMMFLSPSTAGGLRQINTANDLETTVPGVTAWEVAVNPVTHEVFAGGNGGRLHIVDGSTLSVTTVPFAGFPRAVNWLENKVYSGWNTNTIYHRNTNTVTPIGIGENQNDAFYLAFNPAGNRMYTGMEVDGWTTIIEGSTDSAWNLPLQTNAYPPPAVLLGTNHVYFPGIGYTVAVDDTSQMFRIVSIDNPHASEGGSLVQAIAANQTTGRVYVVNDWRMGWVAVLQDAPWRCSASISPTGAVMPSVGLPRPDVSVTTSPECSWAVATTASSSIDGGSFLFDPWHRIYTGSGKASIAAWANSSLIPRTGSVKIAGQLFTVRQASSSGALCSYSISPSGQEFGPGGGAGSVSVNAAGGCGLAQHMWCAHGSVSVIAARGCGWSASDAPNWIKITSGDRGSGGGTLRYQVAANSGTVDRAVTIMIAEQRFTVVQAGVGLPSMDAGSVVNSADGSPGLAPGGLVSIYGGNLASGMVPAPGTPLPTVLLGTTVEVASPERRWQIPLLFVSVRQIDAQLPFDLGDIATIRVITAAGSSLPVTLSIPRAAPRVF